MKKIIVAAAVIAPALLVVVFSSAQQTPPAFPVQQQRPPGYTFVPFIQPDVINTDDADMTLAVQAHAWPLFVALNWPAPRTAAEKGIPDQGNVIGGAPLPGAPPRSLPPGPTVWQTFKDTNEIFLPGGVKPAPFDDSPVVPAPCLKGGGGTEHRRVLHMTEKASDILQSIHEANPNVRLIAQNGKEVWYEVRVNRAYYDYVVRNGFYNRKNQKGKTISFPAGSNTGRGDGAIRVKAAWMEIDNPRLQPFLYTSQALLYSPKTQQCREATMGLVGLHIVQKTKTLPNWIWLTFEHSFNAPDAAQLQNGGAIPAPPTGYFFYDPKCHDCPINQPPANGEKYPRPTQVVRLPPTDSTSNLENIETLNSAFTTALRQLRPDNVWQYYRLIDVQWGVPPGNEITCLTNATMETYIQCGRNAVMQPGQQGANVQGCMACHARTQKVSDFDFQLLKAQPGSSLPQVRRAIDALDGVQ